MRCGSVLYRGIHSDPNRMAAITLGAIVTFLIAQFFPIVELQIGGYSTSCICSCQSTRMEPSKVALVL